MSDNKSNQATKKGIILLLGIIIGLLVGVLVAFIVVNKIQRKDPPVLKVVSPEPSGTKDTIYKYIVHQYQNQPDASEVAAAADSLQTDSIYAEDYSMDYMLEDEDDDVVESRAAAVASEKMISRTEAQVLYFDTHKNVVEAPENAPKSVEVQFWSTPFQNKIVYQFDRNILKVKGLKLDNVYLIHYNNRYYLQSGRQVYQIQPTTEYLRLIEVHNMTFSF